VKTSMMRLGLALLSLLMLAGSSAWAQTEIDQLRARAEHGELSAELKLAQAYFLGKGVARDPVEATRWFRKAADQGEPQSQRILGLMYRTGSAGLPKDEAQAAGWFLKAAGHGDAPAQAELGDLYDSGRGGLAKDPVQARTWYSKAANQGNAGAQVHLGEMYENARGGLDKDDTEALAWYRKAADQGNTAALNDAARLCVTSTNPQVRDPNMGVEYARKAVTANDKNPIFLSTLALAYSVEGEFADAVQAQQQALALVLPFQRADYEKKLKEYELALEQSKQEPAVKTAWPQ